jgi:hypothetical protein
MNEFIDKRVIKQLRDSSETVTILKLNDKEFMDSEREIAMVYVAQNVDRNELTRCHDKCLNIIKMRIQFFTKFSRLTVDDRKIFVESVADYTKEMNLYNTIMKYAGGGYVSLDNLKKFEGDISFDEVKRYTDTELKLLLDIITDL